MHPNLVLYLNNAIVPALLNYKTNVLQDAYPHLFNAQVCKNNYNQQFIPVCLYHVPLSSLISVVDYRLRLMALVK